MSAVAIISPHLFLPILNYYATYTTYATGLSYLYHPSTLIVRKLKRPLCVVLITWSFLVRHLTNGEVLKIVFYFPSVRQLPTEGLSRRTSHFLKKIVDQDLIYLCNVWFAIILKRIKNWLEPKKIAQTINWVLLI